MYLGTSVENHCPRHSILLCGARYLNLAENFYFTSSYIANKAVGLCNAIIMSLIVWPSVIPLPSAYFITLSLHSSLGDENIIRVCASLQHNYLLFGRVVCSTFTTRRIIFSACTIPDVSRSLLHLCVDASRGLSSLATRSCYVWPKLELLDWQREAQTGTSSHVNENIPSIDWNLVNGGNIIKLIIC